MVGVSGALYGNKTDYSFWTAAGPDGYPIHAIMDGDNNDAMMPVRNTLRQALNTDKGYSYTGDRLHSVSVTEMGPEGSPEGVNIPYVGLPEYQRRPVYT